MTSPDFLRQKTKNGLHDFGATRADQTGKAKYLPFIKREIDVMEPHATEILDLQEKLSRRQFRTKCFIQIEISPGHVHDKLTLGHLG